MRRRELHSLLRSFRSFRGAVVCAALLACLATPAAAPTQGVEAVDESDASNSDPAEEPAWLGVEIDGESSSGSGVVVARVLDDSPADRSNLRKGDRILEVGGEAVETFDSLRQRLRALAPGDEVDIRYRRDGSEQTVRVRLSARPSKSELLESQLVGRELPSELGLEPLSRETTWNREDFSGKPLVLEFWATWCYPCRRTARTLQSLHENFEDRVQIVGVSAEDRAELEAFAEDRDEEYPLAHDSGRTVHDALFVSSYPTVVVVDAEGRVAEVFTGVGHADALRATLRELLD